MKLNMIKGLFGIMIVLIAYAMMSGSFYLGLLLGYRVVFLIGGAGLTLLIVVYALATFRSIETLILNRSNIGR